MAEWYNKAKIESKRFVCGHCGDDINSQEGYYTTNSSWRIYLCHACSKPTFIDHESNQTPGSVIGRKIDNLPADIQNLFIQIRNTTTLQAYSASILAARKLLMHIAVDCGAKKNLKYEQYVDYLVDGNYTPPNSKAWVDKIRKMGNSSNHEIVINTKSDAEQIIKFLEMLLLFNYEFAENEKNTSDDSQVAPEKPVARTVKQK